MAHVEFAPRRYYGTLGSHQPEISVNPGDTVSTSTADARGMDRTGEEVTEMGNPQTGPFFINGAEPGDTLSLTFASLVPNRKLGWTSNRLAPFVVEASHVIESHPEDIGLVQWEVDVESNTARLAQPSPGLADLEIPLKPMLGCFGVAPSGGQSIATSTSGPYGGNMDYTGFVSGATVFLPVFADGALFSLGDGHATQGDGEITGTGIEISFDVTFEVNLIKGRSIQWPRGMDADGIFTVGNFRPLDDALRIATTEMVRWLQEMGLEERESHLLLGQCVEYQVGNMFDPAYTMVCRMPKRVLAGIGIDPGM